MANRRRHNPRQTFALEWNVYEGVDGALIAKLAWLEDAALLLARYEKGVIRHRRRVVWDNAQEGYWSGDGIDPGTIVDTIIQRLAE